MLNFKGYFLSNSILWTTGILTRMEKRSGQHYWKS